MRVTPSNDGKRHKKAQQVEYDAIRHIIRKFLINGIIPTVLVLLNDPFQVTIAGITIYQCFLLTWAVNTACVAAKSCQSCHVASLSKPEDRAGQSKHYNPNHDTSALHSLLGLQRDDFHRVADTEVSVDGDASEEEDGAVEVEVKEKTDQAAHEVPEDPAVTHDVTSHKEWQRQAVHEVRRGQVDHVDQRSVPTLGSAERAVEDDRVKGNAEDERERVTDGEENVLVGLVYAARWRWRGGGGRRCEGSEKVLECGDTDVRRDTASG